MRRNGVKHLIKPDPHDEYVRFGRVRCGRIMTNVEKHPWPAHHVKYTTCKNCLAWAKRKGITDA